MCPGAVLLVQPKSTVAADVGYNIAIEHIAQVRWEREVSSGGGPPRHLTAIAPQL